jgi:hypothetical protein
MPQGPGIDNFDHLLADMLADDWLTISDRQLGDKTAMVFRRYTRLLWPGCD